MVSVLVGVGVGYVLGTRAGRERYEQLKRIGGRIADNPAVQGAAGLARAEFEEITDIVRRRAHAPGA